MKRVRIILFVLALLVLGGNLAMAWQPSDWVYHTGAYAYSTGDAEWYYFNSADTQWRVKLSSGVWDELTDATGWNYHQWPYSYSIDTGGWHWFNTSDIQWCIGLTSAQWSEFGETSVPADMALIPAGSFSMGDSFADFADGQGYALPVHTVYVSAFYVDKYEVTKAKWDEVATWAAAHGYDITTAGGAGKAANHPVHTVSWYECLKWCNARSQQEGLTPCYTVSGSTYKTGYITPNWSNSAPDCNWSAGGYRLPTEAEWEKAARGGLSGQRFPWGLTIQHARANYAAYPDIYDPYYDTNPICGYHPDYESGADPYTSPAGSFAANGYGLYDMTGNLMEWCWDWYSSAYYTSSPSVDPHGPESGLNHMLRGGSWAHRACYCRVAFREYLGSNNENDNFGFRCVR